MTFSPDKQMFGLFDEIFAFFGTISPNGSILSLTGNIFKNTAIEPEVLIGQSFPRLFSGSLPNRMLN